MSVAVQVIRLNDKWSLDGRDPNGYMGVAWCFGNHDAATTYAERPILGTIRPMTAAGLERKFKIDAYVKEVADLCRSVRSPALRKKLPQYWSKGGQTGLRSFFKNKRSAPPTVVAGVAVSNPVATAYPAGSTAVAAATSSAAKRPRGGGGGLTLEQRAKMEENKRKAVERRRQRLQDAASAGGSSAAASSAAD